MRSALVVSIVSLAAVACVPRLPEGQYVCSVAATDCPPGWSCVGGRCYAGGAPFAGADAGMLVGDAAPALAADAGAALDTAVVAAPDAASPPDGGAPVEVAPDAAAAPDSASLAAPGDAGAPPPVLALAVGSRHACATFAGGVVSCWGDNSTGALGASPTTAASSVPVVVPTVPAASALCAGTGFSCALGADAQVRCWGKNDLWQLGRAASSPAGPDLVPGVTAATAIACGATHACAVTASGVVCWGGNASQQTGAPSSSRELPRIVAGVHASAVTAGASHTCALSLDGGISCWGGAAMGQLGPRGPSASSLASSAAPVVVPGPSAIAISAGADHTCAAAVDGSVSCWGCANGGRLGVLATGPHPEPVLVAGATAALLVAGGSELSCVASHDAAMALGCWGSASFGELGTGGPLHTGVLTSPTPISSMPGPVTALAAGNGFACATSEGTVFCWGLNDRGQLGDGSTSTQTAPVPVAR